MLLFQIALAINNVISVEKFMSLWDSKSGEFEHMVWTTSYGPMESPNGKDWDDEKYPPWWWSQIQNAPGPYTGFLNGGLLCIWGASLWIVLNILGVLLQIMHIFLLWMIFLYWRKISYYFYNRHIEANQQSVKKPSSAIRTK